MKITFALTLYGIQSQIKEVIKLHEEGVNLFNPQLRRQKFIKEYKELCQSSQYFDELNDWEKKLLVQKPEKIKEEQNKILDVFQKDMTLKEVKEAIKKAKEKEKQ